MIAVGLTTLSLDEGKRARRGGKPRNFVSLEGTNRRFLDVTAGCVLVNCTRFLFLESPISLKSTFTVSPLWFQLELPPLE